MPQSKNDLIALIATNITTNGNAQVSAANVRAVLEQMVDSDLNTVDGDSRIENYSVSNNSGVISNTIAATATLNLCTELLEANESSIGEFPVYRNVAGTSQATYLDEAGDKLLFPSNLQTYSTEYTQYIIRPTLKISHAPVGTNQTIEFFVSLKREVDDTVVSKKTHSIHNHAAQTDEPFTFDFVTFVNTESDPYVVDGMYIEIENSPLSSLSFEVTEIDLRIFKS